MGVPHCAESINLFTVEKVDNGKPVKEAFEIVRNKYQRAGDGKTWNSNSFSVQWTRDVGQYLTKYYHEKKDGTISKVATYRPNGQAERMEAVKAAQKTCKPIILNDLLKKITSTRCKAFNYDFATQEKFASVLSRLYQQLTKGIDVNGLDPAQFVIQRAGEINEFFIKMERDASPVLEDEGDAEFDFDADEDEEEEED